MTSYTWSTAAIVHETETAITVVFDTGGEPFHYKPGQFINLTLPIDGQPITRSYSLSSVQGEDAHPAITVKRVPGGIMSNYIVDQAASIPRWQVSGPYGSFTPPAEAFHAGHVVLLAGGSGITPLFSIARSIISGSNDTHVTLIYSNRTPHDIIFRGKIEDWAYQHKERVSIHYAVSQPGSLTSIHGAALFRGRINKLAAKKMLKMSVPSQLDAAHFFICGPVELMRLHQDVLISQQIPERQVFTEWFAPDEKSIALAPPTEMQEVLLHFYDQSNLLEVQAGKTILSAALEDRIPLPYSCKSGTCGICTARLTSGQVSMANNFALRKSDVESGLILLCQSYPVTGDVTVEID